MGGFVQEPVGSGEEPEGYDVVGLHTGDRFRLAKHGPDPQVCDWVFDSQGFEVARRWCADPEPHLIFMQLGPLEAGGEGHWPAVREGRLLVLVMRPNVLARIALQLPDPITGLELPRDQADVERFAETLAQASI